MALLVVATCLSACGGGGGNRSTGSTSTGTAQAVSVGSAKVSYSGKVMPALSSSSYGVTVQGLSGAAFNFIDFYPQPTLQNTMLLFLRDNALWTYSFLTGQTQQITHFTVGGGIFGPGYATWGPNGLVLLSASNTLSQMYADGTHLTTLSTEGVVSAQTTSWDGTRIAGLDKNGNFVVMAANGTGIKQLVPAALLDPQYFCCTWLGNTVLGYNDLNNELNSVPAAGGSTSPDDIAFSYQTQVKLSGFSDSSSTMMGTANNEYLYSLQWTSNGGSLRTISPSGDYDDDVSVAPDNNTIAIHREHYTGATNDGYSGIWEESVTGENPRLLIPDPSGSDQSNGVATNIQWSNYPSYRRFVGTGGSVATASAGFLTSEVGPALSSFFTFTAKTPSTATITAAPSSEASAPLVFSIHADSILQVWYKNGYILPATTFTTGGATNAVVSFDGTYGQIGFVAPALASRTGLRPTVVRKGSTTECTGTFSGVFDPHGKNLASGTVSKISIDSKTGKLLSWG